MDDGVPESVFVLVSWDVNAPCRFSLVQLKTKKPKQDVVEYAAATRKKLPQSSSGQSFPFPSVDDLDTQLNQKEYVAHFNQPQCSLMNLVFAPAKTSTCTEVLYMFPKNLFNFDATLHGCVFNLKTKTSLRIPPAAVEYRHVVTMGGCIYVLSSPNYNGSYDIPFKRYDPTLGSWEDLEPFPGLVAYKLGSKADRIVATAVLTDAILFNMDGSEIWAYDVERDKWCPVKVDGDLWCCSIVGEAVVIGNTIYALTTRSDQLVLALSIRREGDVNGDHGFVCSLDCKILVDMKQISFPYATRRTRHLIYLGKDNFCLVQSCLLVKSSSPVHQPIQLINIKLNEEHSEKSMTVIDDCVHLLRLPYCEQFSVEFCFFMPECKNTALREGKSFSFDLDPYPVGFDPKQEINTRYNRKPEEEFETLLEPLVNLLATPELLAKFNATFKAKRTSETIYTDAKGHSISVRNLLPVAPFGQFEKELKKGPGKRLEIQFIVDGYDDDKVSAIVTEGFSSRDGEKRSSGLTVGRVR